MRGRFDRISNLPIPRRVPTGTMHAVTLATRSILRLDASLLVLCAALLWMPVKPAASTTTTQTDPHAVVRGMTLSCHGMGQVWFTEHTTDAMKELRNLGVNWITIHPYAGIRSDGTVVLRPQLYEALATPIAEAHALGMKIMIKPHIAYWGSEFSWRGDIAFDTPAQWARFFDTYRQFIMMIVQYAGEADALVVGTELDRTVQHEASWRELIGDVRRHSDAVLTYAANWDRYRHVPFWDALDVIGIQGYFPIADQPGLCTEAQLERGWQTVLRELETYARQQHRRIVFTELGYDRSLEAAIKPWQRGRPSDEADELQQRCMRVALRSIAQNEVVVGAFLWKWFPQSRPSRGRHHHGDFLMSTPAMRAVIAEQWQTATPDTTRTGARAASS
jgi:hypothetical protein